MKQRRLMLLLGVGLVLGPLAACSSSIFKDKKQPLPGERISVLQLQQTLQPARNSAGAAAYTVPAMTENDSWTQPGGNASHSMQNLSLNPGALTLAWKADVGKGASDRLPLTAQPIVAEGKVFAIDRDQTLSAFNMNSGEVLWRIIIDNSHEKNAVIGGGVSYAKGMLYATNGYNEALGLSTDDGHLLWKAALPAPSRAAPGVYEDKVFVTTLDNHLVTLGAARGNQQWDYQGLAQTAGLIGAASPAAANDIVVPGFSSGELDALLLANGSVSWSENLGEERYAGGLASIPDIRGLPVIDRDMVFAVSFGGKMLAIDQRTGNRVWQKDISSDVTPWVAGDRVFVLTLENDLIAMDRKTGEIRWVTPLQRYKDQKDPTSKPVYWTAPVMAGDRLIVASTNGKAADISPVDGHILRDWQTGESISLPLTVANRTLYMVTDGGSLLAYR